jgi:hypothetical protein
MATQQNTLYLDPDVRHLVYFSASPLFSCCGGCGYHRNSDVCLSPQSRLFFLIVPSPLVCPKVLPCFTSPLPGTWRGLITPVPSPLPLIRISPHAIFPYRLGVLVHKLLFTTYIIPPFCTMYLFPTACRQKIYLYVLPSCDCIKRKR